MAGETIAIVDDTLANLKALFDALEIANFRVLVYTDGPSALAVIPQVKPDLILLDVLMPGLDGYQVCSQLKTDESTKDIPVLFMSALDEIFDIVCAFAAGGVDYITKPFRVEEVLARVHTHLTLRQLQQSLEERNRQLEEALAKVKVLRGLLPICANCKKIRDDQGYWTELEAYIESHSEADFTHGICPDCFKQLYPDFYVSGEEIHENPVP